MLEDERSKGVKEEVRGGRLEKKEEQCRKEEE